MAATTNRGITYTGTGTFVTTVDVDLPLWAGVDQDDDTWLKQGAALGTSPAYPGTLGSFEPRQTDGANRAQPRLLCLSLSTALAEGNTLTLSGDVNAIISGMASGSSIVDADLGEVKMSFSGLVCTFSVESTADGTTDDTAPATVWLIVA